MAEGKGRWFAALMRRASAVHEPMVTHSKQRLFAGLSGRVLEIGPGNGVNAAYYPPGIEWVGFEPNCHLAAEIPLRAGWTLIPKPFEGAEFGAYDFVVTTLVLCSVPDPARTLAALQNCLKPGGALLFLEHVAAAPGSRMRRWQNWLCPCWKMLAGGCHPNRETARLIEEAGFELDWMERFEVPLALASPHIVGRAIKKA